MIIEHHHIVRMPDPCGMQAFNQCLQYIQTLLVITAQEWDAVDHRHGDLGRLGYLFDKPWQGYDQRACTYLLGFTAKGRCIRWSTQ